jgi:hypothetical protein
LKRKCDVTSILKPMNYLSYTPISHLYYIDAKLLKLVETCLSTPIFYAKIVGIMALSTLIQPKLSTIFTS